MFNMLNIIFKVLRPNKIKVYIILLSFLFFSINFISLFNYYIDEKIEKETINKEINRLLYINSEDESDKFELLKELPGVEDVYYDLEPLMLNIIELGECYFKHINPTNQVNQVSKKFFGLKSNEVLISDKLLEQQGKNIKDFLYKEIRIVVQDEILKMIVAGVYSSDGFNSQYVYISNDSDINKYITQKNSYLLLIDNVDNYDNVKYFLEENSCSIKYIDDSLKNEKKTYQDLNMFLEYFSTLCYGLLTIVFLTVLVLNVVEKKYSIALLKSFGYNKLLIILGMVICFFVLIVFSFLFSISMIKVLELIIQRFYKINGLFNMRIIVENFLIIIVLFFIMISTAIFYVRHISINKLLKK